MSHFNKIKDIPKFKNQGMINIPGVYCKNCGEVFALYAFSLDQPEGIDENGRPYYKSCFKCDKKRR